MFKYLDSAFYQLNQEWSDFLIKNYATQLQKIDNVLTQLAQKHIIYPPKNLIFRALSVHKAKDIHVVILGQDPYHGENQANGLAFACENGLPPSLRNIYQEVATEYNSSMEQINPNNIVSWHEQGVVLLNATLTVIANQANSLADIGWQEITDGVITEISEKSPHCVFMLWGSFAQKKVELIDKNKHLILTSAHPSPLSAHRGFFANKHFLLANEFLKSHGLTEINWINPSIVQELF